MATLGWIAKPHPVERKVWCGSQLTNVAGVATFAFPAGRFAGPPSVAASVEMGIDAIDYFVKIISISLSGALVEVRRTTGIVVLGIAVTGVATVAPGIKVNIVATEE